MSDYLELSNMGFVSSTELRSRFAAALSEMYGKEVPAYQLLVEECAKINRDVMSQAGSGQDWRGDIGRITAERHGAIRLGTPDEMRQVARIFGALGMFPVGFYDLREASTSAIPVVSTAFRPIASDELAANPFRVFTSLLVTSDRRFFNEDVQQRLETFLSSRQLFSPELLDLADVALSGGGLSGDSAHRFIELATASFALTDTPIDWAWYSELEKISPVAADIGGVTRTHINHLTPRVLDIDQLYSNMEARGIKMIPDIQGPPRWSGPDVLLRQTSFRALDESRLFRMPDGEIRRHSLRVRFGEVEARGMALTPLGREAYDRAMQRTSEAKEQRGTFEYAALINDIWESEFPTTETALARAGLGYVKFALTEDGVRADPIVYEDFLPASAAGIFQSNLIHPGQRDATLEGVARDRDWMEGVIGDTLHDPYALYEAESRESLLLTAKALDIDPEEVQARAFAAHTSR